MNDGGSEPLDGLDLQLVGRLRHEDRRRDLEGRGRVSDALAVVAGGGRDHTLTALLGMEPHDFCERPPHLERADRLDRFHLDVDVAARLVRERSRVLKRGR